MPLVQFRNDPRNINITKRMPTPKRVSQMQAWLKEARKVIPEIPNTDQSDWSVMREEATQRFVKFDLYNTVGERVYVVIDRTIPSIG